MSGNVDDIAKRRAKRRKKARARHLRTGFIIFLLFALLLGAVLSVTVLFPIKNVKVQGSKIYSEAEIIEKCGLKGKNLFTVSSGKTAETLRKTLCFIDNVEIKRQLPDTVSVTVTDAKEYYCFKGNDGYYTASNKGFILEKYDKTPQNTVEIRAEIKEFVKGEKVEYTDKTAEDTVKTIKSELENKNFKINYIDVSDMNNIKAGIENRFHILLGGKAYLDKKCAHLKGMTESIKKTEWGTINLSMWTPSKSEGTFVKGGK